MDRDYFWDSLKDGYLEFWRADRHFEYPWKPKDNKALRGILSSMQAIYTEANSEMMLQKFNGLWLFCFTVLKQYDNWLYEHLDLSTINSKFPIILTYAKRKTHTDKAERLASIVNKAKGGLP